MPSEANGGSMNHAGPGSQSSLRRDNVRRVLEELATAGPSTQAQLSRNTGLSAGTVASIIRDLDASGRVRLERTTSSGRRALNIHLVDTGRVAVGLDIGRRHVRAIVATPSRRILADVQRLLPLGHDALTGMTAAKRAMEEALVAAHRTREQVLGAGVGIPGPFDPITGRVGSGAILPEWIGMEVASRLTDVLDVPVIVANDANLGALAHLSWSETPPGKNFVFVKIGTGIGTGVVIDGELYAGHRGLAGEIGHTIVVDQGLVCRCGNRGCLETVASTSSMLRALAAAPNPPTTTDELVSAALAGDTVARRVVEDAGLSVGQVLGQLASLLNPETILLGGPLSDLGELLLEPIRRSLKRHTVPDIAEATTVRVSALRDRAEALGGVVSVLNRADPTDLYGPLSATSGASSTV
ncbi:MAG: ROK family transcriptional regulator [Arthrobacter sp.]|jgi:predicted NBD/HSP70 family sugar kinase|nr:ROK family transcriptional regulator [Arthrobacter sp.]